MKEGHLGVSLGSQQLDNRTQGSHSPFCLMQDLIQLAVVFDEEGKGRTLGSDSWDLDSANCQLYNHEQVA